MKPFYVHLEINSNLYLKDPQKTKLGRKIIEKSVLLIDEIGLEQFTFKKLAKIIPSTEASIYRYFENKHTLFVYLLNWYWEWMIVRIKFNTMNIRQADEKLNIALRIIVDTASRNTEVEFVNEDVLHRIVVREGAKGYHHKLVDEDNSDGFFLAYKRLCSLIASIILEIRPDFTYPKAFASTLVETANNNIYFARHLPRLTDIKGENDDDQQLGEKVTRMLEYLAFGLLYGQDHQSERHRVAI
ncbi:MAG: TetR/AcrR family transcriptional regulator [Bacteroidota bacterium]